MKQVRARISGKVQGVWFRVYTQREARHLGVTGFVRNLADGRVEFLAQGEETALAALVAWAHKGPENARVEAVSVTAEPLSTAYPDFTITE